MTTQKALAVVQAAAAHPRCLHGWPSTPAEEAADSLLRAEAAARGLNPQGPIDAVAWDISQAIRTSQYQEAASTALRWAASAVEAARALLRGGRIDAAVRALQVARLGRSAYTIPAPAQMERLVAAAAAEGLQPAAAVPSVEALDRAVTAAVEAAFIRGGREALRLVRGLPAVFVQRVEGNVALARLTASGRTVRVYCPAARWLPAGHPGTITWGDRLPRFVEAAALDATRHFERRNHA